MVLNVELSKHSGSFIRLAYEAVRLSGIQIRNNEADRVLRIHKCCLLCKAVYGIQ